MLGQIPSLLRHVQCHLIPTDPRRQEFERIARKLGVKDPDHPLLPSKEPELEDKKKKIEEERGKIVTARPARRHFANSSACGASATSWSSRSWS